MVKYNPATEEDISWDDVVRGIFGSSSTYEEAYLERTAPTFEIRARQPKTGELALGWAFGKDEAENKNIQQLVGISDEQRASTHMYTVGASGSGKSKFLESLIRQDIDQHRGFGVIDPHGDLTEDIKVYLYQQYGEDSNFLKERVILIDPTNTKEVVSFNPLERLPGKSVEEQASELVLAFKKIWADSWGQRMGTMLRYTLIALCENNLTLAELPLFLTNIEVRKRLLENVTNTSCRDYFDEFNRKPTRTIAEWIESTLNKVQEFLADPRIKQVVSAQKSSFNIREAMDEGKILLVKVDRGQLKDAADLFGSLLLSTIQMAAFSRTDTMHTERNTFFLYIDEFQNYASESFIEILDQARKYKLSLVLAHQMLAQLPRQLQASVLTNCKFQMYFQVRHEDANILARESLLPVFREASPTECVNLLQLMPEWTFAAANKKEGEVVVIKTLFVEYPWEEGDKAAEREYRKQANTAGIGRASLRERKELEKEYIERRKGLLEPKSNEQDGNYPEIDDDSAKEPKKKHFSNH